MIGRYGAFNIAEVLSPFTGQAPQTQAGQGFQAVVQAIPGLQAQAYQLANPGTLPALVKREAKLALRLTSETDPVRRATVAAELGLVREQLAALRAALAPAPTNTTEPVAVSTRNSAWIGGGIALAVFVGVVTYFTTRRAR